MTQSEIYDRILSGIINDWYYSEHSNMDKLVAKIRGLSDAYWWREGENYESYISIHYPQYYKELGK